MTRFMLSSSNNNMHIILRMKYLSILSLFLLFAVTSCSSITGTGEFNQLRSKADDSSLSADQRDLLLSNATLLAYQEQLKDDSTFIDLSDELINFYYDVLVTVATSEDGSEYEVTSTLKSFSYINLYSLIAKPKADVPFIEVWQDSVAETGINSIDAILSEKGFEISGILFGDTFVFENKVPTNTVRIADLLEETNHFGYAEINSLIGDGGTIIVERKRQRNEYLKVTYVFGYGDCPSGCIYHDYYEFHVYTDGKVDFIGKTINSPRP